MKLKERREETNKHNKSYVTEYTHTTNYLNPEEQGVNQKKKKEGGHKGKKCPTRQ